MNCPTCDMEYKDDVPHPPSACAIHASVEMWKARKALDGALEAISKNSKEVIEKRDKAWVDALHENGIVDMVDAEGSNKTFILDEVKKRYKAP